jgi:glycerate-2-kinase
MSEQTGRRLGATPIEDVAAALALGDRDRGMLLLEMLAAALAAAEPEAAVARALAKVDLGEEPVTIVALGKAAPAMARGAVRALGDRVQGGIVVSNHADPVPPGMELLVTGHPVPDNRSLGAGRRLLDVVAAVPPSSRVLFLVSGGGSALADVPAAGLSLEDLVATAEALTVAGVPIDEMNTLRTHLSAIKGGRLAAATRARTMTVLLSDVPDSAPYAIASGPTLPCPTVPSDALEVLKTYRLLERVPAHVVDLLTSAPAPPAVADCYVVAADGSTAATAAVAAATQRGIAALRSPEPLTGPAAATARRALADSAVGAITVLAGETTVEVRGGGRGGRNQEAALAAAMELQGSTTMFAAFGTDGVDGPTDAAGALVDGFTTGRIRAGGVDPAAALAANDSHPTLDVARALIRCGPTGTNVADLWIVDRR